MARVVGSSCVKLLGRLHTTKPCWLLKARNFSSAETSDHFNTILAHEEDKYNGVIIQSDKLPSDSLDFTKTLSSSLAAWKELKRRAIWLKIPIEKAQLLEPAVKQGFTIHHADKDYILLTHWLAKPEDNRIPISASHQVGVGCVVLNKKNELLLVQERSGFTKDMNLWKYPTGLLDLGEDIHAGAAREVFEETGVQTKFNSIIAFRQIHQAMFNKSDLFFICLMDLVDENSTSINFQQCELTACEWKHPDVYFGQDFIQRSGVHTKVYSVVQDIIKQRENNINNASALNTSIPTIVMEPLHVGFKPGTADLYFVNNRK